MKKYRVTITTVETVDVFAPNENAAIYAAVHRKTLTLTEGGVIERSSAGHVDARVDELPARPFALYP